MKKLTAIEQLVKELHENGFLGFYCDKSLEDQKRNLAFQLIDKAKQIEKQQIIEAFDIACKDEDRIGTEYYNETFTNGK